MRRLKFIIETLIIVFDTDKFIWYDYSRIVADLFSDDMKYSVYPKDYRMGKAPCSVTGIKMKNKKTDEKNEYRDIINMVPSNVKVCFNSKSDVYGYIGKHLDRYERSRSKMEILSFWAKFCSIVNVLLVPVIIWFFLQRLGVAPKTIALIIVFTSSMLIGLLYFYTRKLMKQYRMVYDRSDAVLGKFCAAVKKLVPNPSGESIGFVRRIMSVEIVEKNLENFAYNILAYQDAMLEICKKAIDEKRTYRADLRVLDDSLFSLEMRFEEVWSAVQELGLTNRSKKSFFDQAKDLRTKLKNRKPLVFDQPIDQS